MGKKLCIHGHFYQPPREDPWFGRIFLEPSAAPMRHWNERITRESYAPLAWARRLDGQGRIAELMNCYEWISFNVGPTLMLWLEREAPELLGRILEADRLSLARWGHGNAIAQVFHHAILPLASELDKAVEIEWALADFRQRFKRESEGIWLSECAADIPTLEAVAARGVKFVVLSPHQARLIRENGPDGPVERQVNAGTLPYGVPYAIKLPSGRSVAAFFYEAGLAQSVAFEGLLSDGEKFWRKIRTVAEAMPGREDLLTLATDGETYGHHFTFGEMALAYVLAQAYAGRDGLELTNFGAYLAASPPEAEVVLHEPSAWSCAHGVERWRGDCGDSTGGHPGWNQRWRAPLREALDFVKKNVDEHYFQAGAEHFKDPRAALLNFGAVLVNPAAAPEFAARHFKDGWSAAAGWLLLRMQENALAAYASCAWFFDEISRIEPVNALRFALLALDILRATGGPDILAEVENILQQAVSNLPQEVDGREIFRRRVLPSRQSPANLCLFAALEACAAGRFPAEGGEATLEYPALIVRLRVESLEPDGRCAGRAEVSANGSAEGQAFVWSGLLPHPGAQRFVSFAEACLEARPAGREGPDELEEREGRPEPIPSGCGAELARYLKDYLSLVRMETQLAGQEESRAATALQLVSTLSPYDAGQNTPNLSQLWSQFAAYLPLAVYRAPLPPEALAQTGVLLDELLADYPGRQMARDLLDQAVLGDLAAGLPDAEISAGLDRVNAVFKRADWWRVQNALWREGRVRDDYLQSARSAGFRV